MGVEAVNMLTMTQCLASYDLAVIDLDNTLYAADNGVFARMDTRMTAFMCRELDMEYGESDALRVRYWKEYGTTLRGLVLHHGIEPEHFLHEVHDIAAHELLQENKALDIALQRLSMRKVIHTNGTVEHAERILTALGVKQHFEAIYDIRYNDYLPKPCAITLKRLIDAEGMAVERTLVVDDMAENLAIAQSLGARTCWVSRQNCRHDWDYQIACFEDLYL